MKLFKNIIIAAALTMGVAACQIDDKLIFDTTNVKNSTLLKLENSYVVTQENLESTSLPFKWHATDAGIPLEINYQVEISTKENNFEYVKTLASTLETSATISGEDLVGALQFFKKDFPSELLNQIIYKRDQEFS